MVWAAALAVLPLRAAQPELLYAVNFDDPAVRAAVDKCPFAKVEKDFEGTSVLTVTVPPDKMSDGNPVAVVIPIDIEKIGAAGGNLYGEGDLKFTGVTRPMYSWNGVKFMLVFKSEGKEQYPDFNPGWQTNCGTKDWYRASSSTVIPKDVKKAYLNLGLQQSSGTVSYRNIRFYRGDASPESTLAKQQVPQAKYTVDLPVHRGVMSPNRFDEKDFADLAKWNANLIRWQLNRPLDRPYTLDEYKAITAKKIDELGKVLDAARKHGIKVVIDLHPFEGGKLILSTPEGRQYLVDVWKEIATRYKGHPAIFGYDILNEPHSRNLRPGDPTWPELAERTIKAIRAIDPVTPIIVEPDQMAHYELLEYLPVFEEPNIIYSIHFYAPGQLTHQLDPKVKPILGYPDETRGWNREYLRKNLEKAREFQQKTGARIYVGEFSCIRWAPGADRYVKDLIDLFEEYGWDWSYHAFREWQGWSAEHSDDPAVMDPVPTTGRKEVLLKAFEKNGK